MRGRTLSAALFGGREYLSVFDTPVEIGSTQRVGYGKPLTYNVENGILCVWDEDGKPWLLVWDKGLDPFSHNTAVHFYRLKKFEEPVPHSGGNLEYLRSVGFKKD